MNFNGYDLYQHDRQSAKTTEVKINLKNWFAFDGGITNSLAL